MYQPLVIYFMWTSRGTCALTILVPVHNSNKLVTITLASK